MLKKITPGFKENKNPVAMPAHPNEANAHPCNVLQFPYTHAETPDVQFWASIQVSKPLLSADVQGRVSQRKRIEKRSYMRCNKH